MRFSTVAAPLALAGLVAAAPAPAKRSLAVRASETYDDATILNYALTLEYLERTFYQEALNNLPAGSFQSAGFPAWVRERFTEVAQEEAVHVNFLSTALTAAGAEPVKQCTYNFMGATKDVKTFRAYAEIFEGVGVSAYLGAAPAITNKAYLAVAGSILVVEAEHETWIRAAADSQDPFPRPFQAPLDFNQVYTLVAPFITGCAGSPALPFHTFPAVTIAPEPFYAPGCELTVTSSASGAKYAAFVSAVATKFVPFVSGQKVVIPEGIEGQSFLILTNSNTGGTGDDVTVAGPAMIFVQDPASNREYNNPNYAALTV